MVYVNKIKDSEYYEDNFEEIIITKTYCALLIQDCVDVFYQNICGL